MRPYYIDNIINYLTDKKYNAESLPNDIETLRKLDLTNNYQRSRNIDGINELFTYYNDMINKRKIEILKYYKAFISDDNYLLSQYNKYYNYPFRQSRDPVMDKNLILAMNHFADSEYPLNILEGLILKALIDNGIKLTQADIDLLHGELNAFGNTRDIIDFDNMRTARFVSRMGKREFPTSYKSAEEMYKINPFDPELIGFMGEYIAYKEIKKSLEPGDEIKWISKELGDGHGYDIIVYNKETNKYIAYEVKAHSVRTNYDVDIDLDEEKRTDKNNILTPTEVGKMFNSKDYNYEYHVIRILLCPEIIQGYNTDTLLRYDDCVFDKETNTLIRENKINNIIEVEPKGLK